LCGAPRFSAATEFRASVSWRAANFLN